MFIMENHTDTEQKLIFSLKNGSRKAFDDIYRMYAKRMYAYSLQYTKSVEDAEDIVQEVFINLWRYRATIRQNETLKSLLFIMAKHLLINAYRSRINHPEYEEYVESMDKVSVDSTQQWVEYADFVKLFSLAIKKLPQTQQRVIRLSRFEQLSNREIAEKLSLSEQTVKNQLSVGLKNLREKLTRVPYNALLFLYLFFL
jgi:RNA polymerase sigma-70 factor (family 1)